MKRLITLGGADLSQGPTLIDEHIVRAAEKPQPRVLAIFPLGDAGSPRVEAFREVYADKLACNVSTLCLSASEPPAFDPAVAILEADVIYIDDCELSRLLDLLRKQGIDRLLSRAADQGKLLVGNGDAAGLWYSFGFNETAPARAGTLSSRSLMRVRGLGITEAIYCAHVHSQLRLEPLTNLLSETAEFAIALDDGAALAVLAGRFHVWQSSPRATAYRMFAEAHDVVVERLDGVPDGLDVSVLMTRVGESPFERMPRNFAPPRLLPS